MKINKKQIINIAGVLILFLLVSCSTSQFAKNCKLWHTTEIGGSYFKEYYCKKPQPELTCINRKGFFSCIKKVNKNRREIK